MKKGDLDINSLDINSILEGVSQGLVKESPAEEFSDIQITSQGLQGKSNIQDFNEEGLLSDILPGFKDEMPEGYYSTPQEPESLIGKVGRNIAGAGQSIASVLAGLPGSILSLPGNIAESIAKKIGFPLRDPEKFDAEKWGIPQEKYLEALRQHKKAIPKGIPGLKESLLDPGLSDVPGIKKGIAEVGKTAFGVPTEFWDPKTATEKTGREYVERVTGLLHPALWPVSLGKALISPIVGFGGKKAAKMLGLGDFWQEVVGGVGEMAFLGWNPKQFKEKMKGAFDKARDILRDPETVVTAVNSKPLSDVLFSPKKFVKNINDPTKAEKWILDRMEGTSNALKGNKVEVEKLLDLKKSFGKHASEFKGDFKDISGFVKKTNDTFEEMIQGFGKKYNPKFLKAYNEASSAFKGFEKMPKYLKTINNAIEKRGDLVTLGLAGGVLTFGTLGKALVGLKLAKNVTTAYHALKNSAAIRNYYLKGIAAASKQNVKSATAYFEKADEELEKKFPGITEKVKELRQ